MNLEQVKGDRLFYYTPWLYGLGIVVILALVFFWNQNINEQWKVFSTTTTASTQEASLNNDISTTTYKYGDVVFQVVGNMYDQTTLEIFQGEKLVFSKTDGGFQPVSYPCSSDQGPTDCNSDSSPTFGVDINGNGNKDFVFGDVFGGSSNSVGYVIFELPRGGTIKELANMESVSGGAVFKDLDGDGKLDIEFQDNIFNCWSTSCAASRGEGGTIILSWNNTTKTYTPNLKLMFVPVSPKRATEVISEQVDFFRKANKETSCLLGDCRTAWNYAIKLIYSGNATTASAYLDQVWPAFDDYFGVSGNFTSVKDFKNQFLATLKESSYYNTVLTLNGGKIF